MRRPPLKRRHRNKVGANRVSAKFGAFQEWAAPLLFGRRRHARRSAVHLTFRLNPVSLAPNLMLDYRGRFHRELGQTWRLPTALLRAGGSPPPP